MHIHTLLNFDKFYFPLVENLIKQSGNHLKSHILYTCHNYYYNSCVVKWKLMQILSLYTYIIYNKLLYE